MDLSHLSDAEILAGLSGGPSTPSAGPDLSSLSDAEILAGAGIEPEDSSFLGSLWEGAKQLGSGMVEGTTGLLDLVDQVNPMAVGGPKLFGLNPMREHQPSLTEVVQPFLAEEDPDYRYARTAGEFIGPGGLIRGAARGAIKQAPKAASLVSRLLNKGLRQDTAAALAAQFAEDKTGDDTIAPMIGALAPSGVVGGVKAIGKSAGSALEDAGQAMRRKSLGVRSTDYNKTAKGLSLYDVADDQVESLTKRVFDQRIGAGELGKSRDAGEVLAIALQKGQDARTRVATAVNKVAEAQKAPVEIPFTNARSYLESGYASVDEIPRLEKILDQVAAGIQDVGKGKVDFIHRQKIAVGNKYREEEFSGAKGFYKALYKDLLNAVDEKVPGYRKMNEEVRDWDEIITPVLKRSLGLEEAETVASTAKQLSRTSGGVGTPILAGVGAGGIAGAGAGVTTAAIIALANTPRGREIIGRKLVELGKAGKAAKITGESVPVIVAALSRELSQNDSEDAQSLQGASPSPEGRQVATDDDLRAFLSHLQPDSDARRTDIGSTQQSPRSQPDRPRSAKSITQILLGERPSRENRNSSLPSSNLPAASPTSQQSYVPSSVFDAPAEDASVFYQPTSFEERSVWGGFDQDRTDSNTVTGDDMKDIGPATEAATELEKRGYSPAAIAGILGNIEVETGGSFDHRQTQHGGGNGYGLFQFDFMRPYYETFLEDHGLEDSVAAQVEFVDRVIALNEPMKKTPDSKPKPILGAGDRRELIAAFNTDDAEIIARAFMNVFEKPGKPHEKRRIAAAKAFEELMA